MKWSTIRGLTIIVAIGTLVNTPVRAADLEVGQIAPEFSVADQDGRVHKLSDYHGKTVILAFYPKDFTGG